MTEEVPCYYPRIYPSKSDTPAPSVRPLIVFSQTPTHTPFVFIALSPCHQTIFKHQLQLEPEALSLLGGIHFVPVRRHALEYIVLAILVSWRRIGDNEDGRHARRLAALSPTWLQGEHS